MTRPSSGYARRTLLAVSLVLPSRLKVALLRRQRGWTIGRDVSIGLSWLDAESVTLGDGATIGHFNVVRNLLIFRMGPGATIKNFNSFFGAGAAARRWFPSTVEIGARSSLMSHHFVDGAGTLRVGDDVMIGGRSTEIYTHQRELRDSRPALGPTTVLIGDDVYIGARSTLVSCQIPPRAVVGAGAVVVKDHRSDSSGEPVLIAGNPAQVMKRYE